MFYIAKLKYLTKKKKAKYKTEIDFVFKADIILTLNQTIELGCFM